MSKYDCFEDVIKKITFLESQLGEVNKKINSLQQENQELRKLVFCSSDSSNFKRPASSLENPSAKKFKFNIDLITPEIKNPQENLFNTEKSAKSENNPNSASSQRRQVMKEIVKDFHSNVLPRYQDHLTKERNLVPKLRSNDGRIILKNIRYIR